MLNTVNRRTMLACGTAAIVFSLASPATAQDASGDDAGLDVIVVTAQRREQNVQDVPIAVTAIGGETLQANRVLNVADLSGLAPGLTVMPTAGASRIPSFTMRGAVANGSVNGSDRQVSVYLDGVYLSAPRGAIFDLPDARSIEVLRGPQGTLFGRNATAGAISVTTRDPKGEIGVKASATVGNYDQFRFGLSVDLPQVGPFSGFLTYVHDYQQGDIRNLGAGQTWDRRSSLAARYAKVWRSPKYLGTRDMDSWFGALKFESGDFTTVYKYDRTEAGGSSGGTALVGYETAGVLGNLVNSVIQSQPVPVPLSPNAKRPAAVRNSFATDIDQTVQGHNLTSTYQVSDSLSIKNIFAFRKSQIFGGASLDGFSALVLTQQALPAYAALTGQPVANLQPLVGSPFLGLANAAQARSEQLSDELQFNYNSDLLTATVGLLWFKGKDWTSELYQQTTISFTPIPGGVLPNRSIGRAFNEAKSLAAYTQLELHITPNLDVIAGGRVTRDRKSGDFTTGPTLANLVVYPFTYRNTRPTYLIGVNYKPNDDTLVYGKFSTGFVSGGSVVGIPFAAETVKSFEGGLKAEMFDRKLRTNLALFRAKYRNVQGPQSATTPGSAAYIAAATGGRVPASAVGTFVSSLGNITAYGFELDVEAAPAQGFTLGGATGYTHTKISNINPIILAGAGGRYDLAFRPDWTASAWAQYDTPHFGDGETYVSLRADMRWQSKMNFAQNRTNPAYAPGRYAAGILDAPSYAVYNARAALKGLNLGGVDTTVAVWGKNLADNRTVNYALFAGGTASANFIPARTYGVDLTIDF